MVQIDPIDSEVRKFDSSLQDAENANASIEDDDDFVIPETQEVLSQESVDSLDDSRIIVEQNKSELLPNLKMNLSQSIVSILSISSCDDQEVTQINLNAQYENPHFIGDDVNDIVYPNVEIKLDETTKADGKSLFHLIRNNFK